MRILVSGSTKTMRQLGQLWPDHLGILLTPGNWNTVTSVLDTGLPWAVDNGAFSGFDPVAFRDLLSRARGQPRLLWVVVPDVVGDARATLALFREWQGLASDFPLAFVLQDGQDALPLPEADCYFVGGSTRFKLSQASADLCGKARRRGALLHMGRVNSLRRLRVAHDRSCDSVDGSAYSRWRHTNHRRRNMSLERHLAFVRELEGAPCLYDG